MTEDRFQALASAYGADIARWPEPHRAAAQSYAQGHPERAERMLERERRLDLALAAHRAGESSAVLRDRIHAEAPLARAAGRAWRWLMGAGVGLGLAAACAAGVAVGFTLAPTSVTRLISGPPSEPADEVSALVAPSRETEGA
ncbi:MAG: hypothetical protein ACHP7N_10810 [Caulobacterales bacterium]